MGIYFGVTVLMEALLLYTIYKVRKTSVSFQNCQFVYLIALIGMILVLVNFGVEFPVFHFQRDIAGLTAIVVFWGLLFIRQINDKYCIIKEIWMDIFTFLIIGMFLALFIFDIRNDVSSLYNY